jgi:hypothetical protein
MCTGVRTTVGRIITEKVKVTGEGRYEVSVFYKTKDPLTILLPDPEDPEGFHPLLFSDRPLTCDQWDNFYLPSSLF